MRNIYFCLIAFIVIACNNQEEEPVKRPVTIDLAISQPTSSGGRIEQSLLESVYGRITVKDADSVTHMYRERFDLIKTESGVVSALLVLESEGNYVIEEFILYDDQNMILFIAPRSNSPNERYVDDDKVLPLEFYASENVGSLEVQVITKNNEPLWRFGYFQVGPIELVSTQFVYVKSLEQGENGLNTPVTSILDLTVDEKVYLENYLLQDYTDTFRIPEKIGGIYYLLFNREGFCPIQYEFDFDSIQRYTVEPLLVQFSNPSVTDQIPLELSGWYDQMELGEGDSLHFFNPIRSDGTQTATVRAKAVDQIRFLDELSAELGINLVRVGVTYIANSPSADPVSSGYENGIWQINHCSHNGWDWDHCYQYVESIVAIVNCE